MLLMEKINDLLQDKSQEKMQKLQHYTEHYDTPMITELKQCGLYDKLRKEYGLRFQTRAFIDDNDLMKLYKKLYRDCCSNTKTLAEAKDIVCKVTAFHWYMPGKVKNKLYAKAVGIADGFNSNPTLKTQLMDFIKTWGEETFRNQDISINSENPEALEVLERRKKLLLPLQDEIFSAIKAQFDSRDTTFICENTDNIWHAYYSSKKDAVVFNTTNVNLLRTSGRILLDTLIHEMHHSDQHNDIGKGDGDSVNPRKKKAYKQWEERLAKQKTPPNTFLLYTAKFYTYRPGKTEKEYLNNPLEQGAVFVARVVMNRLLSGKTDYKPQNNRVSAKTAYTAIHCQNQCRQR